MTLTKKISEYKKTMTENIKSKKITFCSIIFIYFLLFWVLPIECYTKSISHVPNLQKGNAFILITDLGGMGPSVTISFYDDYGHEVSVINKLLRPKGKLRLAVGDQLKTSGCIVVESPDDMIFVEYWYINHDKTLSIIPFHAVSGDERYFLNCFRFPSCQETYITLSDPNGTGPMIQMEFYAKTGGLTKIIRKMLRPRGVLVLKVSDYIDKNIQSEVSIRSFGGGISVYGIHICNKKSVFIIPNYISSNELVLGDFTTDKDYAKDIVINDISAKGTNVKVSLMDFDGNLVREIQHSIHPNSSILIKADEEFGDFGNGYIRIRSGAEISASLWEKNLKLGNHLISEAVPNPLIENRPNYSDNLLSLSYYVFDNNVEFLFSLLNIGRKSAIVELDFYNANGGKIGNKKIILEPDKRILESVNQFFGKNKLGTIVIKGINSSLIATSKIFNIDNGVLLGKTSATSR
jgi:hypothetical protein